MALVQDYQAESSTGREAARDTEVLVHVKVLFGRGVLAESAVETSGEAFAQAGQRLLDCALQRSCLVRLST